MPDSIPSAGKHPLELVRVKRFADCDQAKLRELLARFGLLLEEVPVGRAISGSYWGDAEAGLIGNRLSARSDTPLHSILHEACHYVCMDAERRDCLYADAGGFPRSPAFGCAR